MDEMKVAKHESNSNSVEDYPATRNENHPARRIANEFAISLSHARAVAFLAGIGDQGAWS